MRRIALAALAAVYLAGCAGPQQFVQQCRIEVPYPPPPPIPPGDPLFIPEEQRLAGWEQVVQACAQNYANQHNNRVAAGVALGVLAVFWRYRSQSRQRKR